MWTPPVVDMENPNAPEIISKACKDHGFFYLENHGVPKGMMQQVFDQSKAFFEIEIELKMTAKANNNCGYRPMGFEIIDKEGQSKGDTKESFDMWSDLDPDSKDARRLLSGPNVWPAESLLPGWKATMTDYFKTMNTLAGRVTVLLAVSIGVDSSWFKGCFSEALCAMRMTHYSSEVSDPGEGVFGVGEHTDFGVLTLLATDEVPGLQVFLDGEWIDVPPRPGAFICNIGDMLQRWTNDHLQSTVHRVVNKLGRERYSIAFFSYPDFDTEVVCLPQFCSEDDPAKYLPTTSGAYLLKKNSEYVLKGEM